MTSVRSYLSTLTVTSYGKIALWLALFILFYEIEFALVFLAASFLYFMYYSPLATQHSSDPARQRNAKSAYSVFNKGCEKLDGDLDADQFDREIRRQMY